MMTQKKVTTYQDLLVFFKKAHTINDYVTQELIILDNLIRFELQDHYIYYYINQELIGSFSREYKFFKLVPSLLDHPLVLKLTPAITLLPTEQHTVYIERPITLDLCVMSDPYQESHCIHNFPLVPLKMTTYGKVQNAMLCYYWQSQIFNQSLATQELFATVPLRLTNTTKKKIMFQKLVIYKNYLQLYLLPSQMITCAVHIKITSRQDAYIQYDDVCPIEVDETPLHTVSYLHQTSNNLFKKLRQFKRKGTGIEYGF